MFDKADMQKEFEKTTRRSKTRGVPNTRQKLLGAENRRIFKTSLVVQAKRRERISKAQDEEEKWATLKLFLRGEFGKLTHGQFSCAGKILGRFVLSEDGILYYLGRRREVREMMDEDPTLRFVFPTTLIDEILLNCHDSVEGEHQGIVRRFHRVKTEFYWTGIYADVANKTHTGM